MSYPVTHPTTTTTEAREGPPADMRAYPCSCGELKFLFSGQFVCWEKCPHCGAYELLAWSSCLDPSIGGGRAHN
jgi:hypothetical protein